MAGTDPVRARATPRVLPFAYGPRLFLLGVCPFIRPETVCVSISMAHGQWLVLYVVLQMVGIWIYGQAPSNAVTKRPFKADDEKPCKRCRVSDLLVPQGGIERLTRGFSDLRLTVYADVDGDVAGIRSQRGFPGSPMSTPLLPYPHFWTLLVTPDPSYSTS